MNLRALGMGFVFCSQLFIILRMNFNFFAVHSTDCDGRLGRRALIFALEIGIDCAVWQSSNSSEQYDVCHDVWNLSNSSVSIMVFCQLMLSTKIDGDYMRHRIHCNHRFCFEFVCCAVAFVHWIGVFDIEPSSSSTTTTYDVVVADEMTSRTCFIFWIDRLCFAGCYVMNSRVTTFLFNIIIVYVCVRARVENVFGNSSSIWHCVLCAVWCRVVWWITYKAYDSTRRPPQYPKHNIYLWNVILYSLYLLH